jgi:hypothetical protein
MNKNIKDALNNYWENKDQTSAHNFIRTMRNGIEVIGGITIEDLYTNKIAFNSLVRLAKNI